MTKIYGKAEGTAQKIIEAFEAGNIAAPLATVFLQTGDRPMHGWSYWNRLSCALFGCTDARGYKQWQKVGRHVRKGEKARCYILYPVFKNWEPEQIDPVTGEPRKYLAYFGSSPVWDVSQTDGEPLDYQDKAQELLDDLPLVEVAKAWDLEITVYRGHEGLALGWFSQHQRLIALGVENLSTWLHELTHAADGRLNELKGGQHWDQELVAELGGAILAHLVGRPDAADEGGCFEYCKWYADQAGLDLFEAFDRVLKRTCAAVELIVTEANAHGLASALFSPLEANHV